MPTGQRSSSAADDVTGKTRGRTGANLCVTKSAPCWCMWWRQVGLRAGGQRA